MANYNNNLGQTRLGWRTPVVNNSPVQQTNTISASLLQSLYGVWNGDTSTNELGTSLYGVWNAEYSGTASLETSLYGVWNGESTTNTLDTSIYALYKAEGNANDSIGTNHGTLMNGATFSTGKIGTKSFYFDGVNDYISLPNNSLNFTGDFSISLWVDVSGISTWSYAFNAINNLSGNYGWRLALNGNAYYFEIGNGSSITQLYFNAGSDSIAQIAPLVGSAMKNVTITRKAGVGTKMYINSVLKLSNTSTSNPSYLSTMSPKIGDGNTITKMDNIGFWNKELSPLEVAQLYNNNNGVDYPFNGNLLASPGDAFGTNHGVVMNGCNFTTGKFGNAFSFDGVDDYVQLPTNSLSFTGDFSVSFWVYFDSNNSRVLNNNGSIISAYNNTGGQEGGWVIRATSANSFRFVILPKNNSSAVALDTATNTFLLNRWNHVVVTRKMGTSSKIYVNGSLSTSNTSSLDPLYYTTSNCSIGALIGDTMTAYSNINYVDALSTWTRELSANEVSMLYNGSNGTQYQSGSFGLTQSSLDSFGTYHGTLSSTSFGTGKFGSAFNFTGGNINMGTGAANFGTNPFTISLWFYPNAGNNLQMLVAKGFTGGTDKGFYLNTDNRYNSNQNGISFGLCVGGGTYRTIVTTSAFPYTAAAWNHLVVTRSGNTTLIYLNGVLASTTNAQVAGSGDVSGDISNTSANMLLAQYGSGGLNFSGRMDALTMWNRAISVDEVTQLYNSGTGTQYPFVGTFSSAGNQLGMDNGTLANGCYLSTGKIGQAFTFDGVNDYVQLTNNSLNFTGDFSCSLWFNLSTISGYQTLLSNYRNSAGNDYGYCINIVPSGKLEFWGYAISTTSFAIGSVTTFNTNTWYHVSVTKTSSSVKIYVNGLLERTYSVGVPMVYFTTMNPSIGALYNWNGSSSAYFVSNGSKIDAVSVWQKELTQSEITELYNSGNGKQITTTSIVKSGLILNLDPSRKSSYPNSGTTWYDISGNGYSGNMINGPVFGTASGGEIIFDGVNDYASFPVINTGNVFTVQVWAKISRFGGGMAWNRGTLVNNSYNWGGNTGFFFFVTSQAGSGSSYAATPGMETFSIAIGQDVTGASAYIGSLTNYVNKWVNLTAVLNGTNPIKLYINGVEVSSYAGQGNGPSSINYTSNFVLGSRILESCDFTQGTIGSVHMYNRALSASDILQNFNATKSRFGY